MGKRTFVAQLRTEARKIRSLPIVVSLGRFAVRFCDIGHITLAGLDERANVLSAFFVAGARGNDTGAGAWHESRSLNQPADMTPAT